MIPAFNGIQLSDEITILDICFGLGFNTLATIHYIQREKISTKLRIYSPELDSKLISSLKDFTYPQEFQGLESLIDMLVDTGFYSDEYLHVELFTGDAREYIRTFPDHFFDIVYQDAFSPAVNPILWTQEYFKDIRRILKRNGI